MKNAITEEPVLSLPNLNKPFELHTDAFDFTISSVLMQDGHPIVFESWKLNDNERRYTVQEKEMAVVIHYFHTMLGE